MLTEITYYSHGCMKLFVRAKSRWHKEIVVTKLHYVSTIITDFPSPRNENIKDIILT